MTRNIIIASNAVGPECGRGTPGHKLPRPQRASGMARFSFRQSVIHNQAIEPGLGNGSGPALPVFVADRGGASATSEIFRNGRLAFETWAGRPSNLLGGFKALRSPILSRIHDANQPTRGHLVSLFGSCVWVLEHGSNHARKDRQGVEKNSPVLVNRPQAGGQGFV